MSNLASERKALAENTIEEILQTADEFDAMAARTSTKDGKQALQRLAARFRIYASERSAARPKGR